MKIPFSYTVKKHDAGYIYVIADGHANEMQVENMYVNIRSIAMKENCPNILLNATAVVLDYPMDKFVPVMKRLISLFTELNIARVCTFHDYKQDLIQNVACKSKVNLKNFTNESDAKTWLLTYTI